MTISRIASTAKFLGARPDPQANMRIFCLPPAGRGASFFAPWSAHLAPDIQVCPIHLPGREIRFRESPFTRLMPLVDALSNEILPWLDQPWAVFGHSMGGLIGFELVRYLAVRHGILPVHLFVSACVSPSWMAQRARLHQLPDADFINELQRRYNALPDAIMADEELLGLFIPILRADCELLDTYTYDPALSLACRITAYGGREDHEMQEKELEAWREETQAEFNLQLFSGGHFYLQENLAPVLEAVARSLTNHPSGGTVV